MTDIVSIENKKYEQQLLIKFMIGNTCNYNCWYCFPESNYGTHRWPDDPETVINNTLHVVNYIGKRNNKFLLTGGEPTLWPGIKQFCMTMQQHGIHVTVNTNASRSMKWWNNHLDCFNKVNISVHPETDLDHIIAVANLLYKNQTKVDVTVLMDPKQWNICVDKIEYLKSRSKSWEITAQKVITDNIILMPEQTEYFKNPVKRKAKLRLKDLFAGMPERIKITRKNKKTEIVKRNHILLNEDINFNGWKCNLGLDILFINRDGTLSGSCENLLYNDDKNYNVFDEDFKQKFNPILQQTVCSKTQCSSCEDEVNMTKRKI